MNTLYLYFSGTGNTKHALQVFAEAYETEAPREIHSIEENLDFSLLIEAHQLIVIGYPIYGSMMPEPMQRFIQQHKKSFTGKQIIVICTQVLFSGDGAALALYDLKGVDLKVKATIHVNMPNNITDLHIFPIKTVEESKKKLDKATTFIKKCVVKMKAGKTYKMGRRWYSRMLGYLTQRVHFKMFYKALQKHLKVNNDTCIQCGLCVKECPSGNLSLIEGKIVTDDQCYLCYRCINTCPTQSFRLLGRHYPQKQYYKK